MFASLTRRFSTKAPRTTKPINHKASAATASHQTIFTTKPAPNKMMITRRMSSGQTSAAMNSA